MKISYFAPVPVERLLEWKSLKSSLIFFDCERSAKLLNHALFWYIGSVYEDPELLRLREK